MAINKKLIHFNTKVNFNTQLLSGNILDTSIVFIKETKEIWTHGLLYPCPLSLEEITTLLSKKVDKVTGKSLVSDSEIEKLLGLPNNTELNNLITTAKAAGDNAQSDLNAHKLNKSNPHEVTKAQVGLGNVTNDALVKRSEMGVANGVATLDANGKLLEEQLPSSSREVIKFSGDLVGNITFEPAVGDTGTLYYYPAHGTLILRGNNGKYYSDWINGDFCGTSSANGRVPVIGKIYIDAVNNILYLGSRTGLTKVGPINIGEEEGTAYDGSKGAELSANLDLTSSRLSAVNIIPFNGFYDDIPSGTTQIIGVWWNQRDSGGSFIVRGLNGVTPFGYTEEDYNNSTDHTGRTDRIFRYGSALYRVVNGELKELGNTEEVELAKSDIANLKAKDTTTDLRLSSVKNILHSSASWLGLESEFNKLDSNYNNLWNLANTVKRLDDGTHDVVEKAVDVALGSLLCSMNYDELLDKRDSWNLTPGVFYKIEDYETTVADDPEARSAGHPFDIIVLALDNHTLSERAWAMRSDRDGGYFDNSKVEAWQVWYCLDNDKSRFQWADKRRGTGVIYRLIDEWGNDCPYDFKNIQFKRYAAGCSDTRLTDFEYHLVAFPCDGLDGIRAEDGIYTWAYTFSFGERDPLLPPESFEDCSLLGFDYKTNPNYNLGYCGNNVIKPVSCRVTLDSSSERVFCLNNIVWLSDGCTNHFTMHNNIVEGECMNMTLSGFSVYIGYDTRNVLMGDRCYGVTIKGQSSNNIIGSRNHFITIDEMSWDNIIKADCGNIVLGWGTIDNYIDESCSDIVIGSDCLSNSIQDHCMAIRLESDCYSNELIRCNNISLEGHCSDITILPTYSNSVIEKGCYKLNLIGRGETPLSIRVLSGCSGSSDTRLNISPDLVTNSVIYAGVDSSGELRMWVPADVI